MSNNPHDSILTNPLWNPPKVDQETEQQPQQTAAVVRNDDINLTIVVSRESETGDIEVTPFYNGHMAASVRFPHSAITVEPNSNWRFPMRLVNEQGQQLWLTTDALVQVLDELKRYFCGPRVEVQVPKTQDEYDKLAAQSGSVEKVINDANPARKHRVSL